MKKVDIASLALVSALLLLALQIDALEFVHSKGYLYLDVNPDNAMFGRGGEQQEREQRRGETEEGGEGRYGYS